MQWARSMVSNSMSNSRSQCYYYHVIVNIVIISDVILLLVWVTISYKLFWNNLQINGSGYYGDAEDSFSVHNHMNFTTRDQDNDKKDEHNCASHFSGTDL